MIVHMLIVLGLMGGFVIVAERLFRLSLQTTAKAAREEEDLIRLDQVIGVLRADLWHAAKADAPDKSRLLITAAPSDAVQWQTDPSSGDLTRNQNDEERRWTELGLEFERQGPWVVVRRRGAEVALLQLPAAAAPNRSDK
jgi:hypothetical protein